MKLDALASVEESKMESEKTDAESPSSHEVNGNGVQNGNGTGTAAEEKITHNGSLDVKSKTVSLESMDTDMSDEKSDQQDSNPQAAISNLNNKDANSEKDIACNIKPSDSGENKNLDSQDTSPADNDNGSQGSPSGRKDSDSGTVHSDGSKDNKTGGPVLASCNVDTETTPKEVAKSVVPKESKKCDEVDLSDEKKVVGEESLEKDVNKSDLASQKESSFQNLGKQDSDGDKSKNDGDEMTKTLNEPGDQDKPETPEVDPLTPRRSSRISSLEKNATPSKKEDPDQDLEKVKSGGLTLKLDSGEEFSVQLADEEEEEEARSHCRPKTPETDSDDDVTVVRVETKPKPKAEIRVSYGGPVGSNVQTLSKAPNATQSLPLQIPLNYLSAGAPGTTNVIPATAGGGNIFVPVQFPSTSLFKPGQVTLPVVLNTHVAGVQNVNQITTVKSVASNAYKPATTVQLAKPIDPVAAANYVRAKEQHAKKIEEYQKLSLFLIKMRNKVTIKSTVDAMRDHVVKRPEYKRAEAARQKALNWKIEPAGVLDKESDREGSATPAGNDIDMPGSASTSSKDANDSDQERSATPAEKDVEKPVSISDKESKESRRESSGDGDKSATTAEKDEEVENKDIEMKDATDDVKDIEMKDATDDVKEKGETVNKDDTADVEMKEKADDDGDKKSKEDSSKDKEDEEEAKSDDKEKKSVEKENVGEKSKAVEVQDGDESTTKDIVKPTESKENKDASATDSDVAEKKDTVEEDASIQPAPEQNDKGDHEEAAKKLRPVARFLYYSGLDLAREYIYKDLLDKQEDLLEKKKLTFGEEEDFHRLRRIYTTYRRKNRPMHPKVKKCTSCNYQSESTNAMHYHQEHGHVDLSSGRYECALCDFDSRAASAFKYHMEAEHSMVGRVTIKPCFWHCDLCPYEHNNKAMVIKHKMKCGKKFDIKKHLFPTYDDINFLFRALPGPSIGVNPVQTPPVPPKPANSSWSTVGPKSIQNKTYSTLPTNYPSITNVKPPQIVTYMTSNGPIRVQLNQSTPAPQMPIATGRPTLIQHLSTPTNRPASSSTGRPTLATSRPASSSTTVSSLGKRPAAPIAQAPAKVARSDLEVCEICGGFIKDRHSLRLHFKMAHCIEIDESVITTKQTAPLSCDICMKRFWTFQGLTMHRVSMNHIPQANAKSVRGSKCFICSVFVADIMKHINSTHNMIPGQLNTIRICPVCGITMSPGNLVTHLKILHSMVLPVPQIAMPNAPQNPADKKIYTCPSCRRSFISLLTLSQHIDSAHSYKCHLCNYRCTSIETYKSHITKGHKKTTKKCQLCKKSFIGSAFSVHVLKEHCRKFSIKVERCDHLVDLYKGSGSAAPVTKIKVE